MAQRKRKKTFTVIPLPPGFTHPREWGHLHVDNEQEAKFLVETLGIPRNQIWTFDEWMEIAKEYWEDIEREKALKAKRTGQETTAVTSAEEATK
jgi:hypothetical protein